MKTDLSQLDTQVEALHERVDLLLEKLQRASQLLAAVKVQCDDLPSEDDWHDYCRAMPSSEALREFAEVWASDELPTIDELHEYANAAGQVSAGLQAAS